MKLIRKIIDNKPYYFMENKEILYCINKYSYHEDNDPENEYLKKWYIIYKYNKRNDFDYKDYVYSWDYKDYFFYENLKEVKKFLPLYFNMN